MKNNQTVMMLGGRMSSSLLLRLLVSSTLVPVDLLSKFGVNDVEAALALSFTTNEYRTGNTSTTFADAFMGNSPKLTYDPGSASSSQSTMVNSAGHLVWAPHNLVTYSEDFSQWDNPIGITVDSSTTTDPLGGSTAYTYSGFSGVVNNRLTGAFSLAVGVPCTFAIWLKGAAGETISIELDSFGAPENTITLTGDWQLETISNSNPVSGIARVISRAGNTADVVSIWGAHLYRSDLGGMAPVPGAVGDFQYYVPTNGNEVHLPRVGHHVYNGSAWVNEGLLIESEPRTNLVTYSEDFSQWGALHVTTSLDGTISPDGTASATKLQDNAATSNHTINSPNATISSGAVVGSVYLKAGTLSWARLRLDSTSSNIRAWFDLSAGKVGSVDPYGEGVIEDVGNGWFRCSVIEPSNTASTATAMLQVFTQETDAQTTYSGSSSHIYVYGAQLEEGSTPSSYIPTSGSTVTRGGQSLVVPPAEFGWPEPEYIGSELLSGTWASAPGYDNTTTGSGTSVSAISGTTVSRSYLNITGATVGSVMRLVASCDSASTGGLQIYAREGLSPNAGTIIASETDAVLGSQSAALVFTVTTSNLTVLLQSSAAGADFAATVSVREINPLSVSMQMDGRMTYADGNQTAELNFVNWYADFYNSLRLSLTTGGALPATTGSIDVVQRDNGVTDRTLGALDYYSPGINVPFNISSRHGSTFVNSAVDGVALTADTTPKALPDLSSKNLEIAQDFMGTIGTFRQFAGDIGDTGLVTATNPSTEPTLSLTFDGTGGSFYNLSWSE